MNLHKRCVSLFLVTVVVLNLLIVSGFAEPRWLTLFDTEASHLLLDTMTFSSELKTYKDSAVYTAMGWYKIENKETSDDFKTILRRFELKVTFRKNNSGANLETRVLEDYAYDWTNKEVFHDKKSYSEWKAVVPGSGEEKLMVEIMDWDIHQRQKNVEQKTK